MIRKSALVVVLTLLSVAAFTQSLPPLSLTVTPTFSLPIGPAGEDGENLYTLGGGASLTVGYRLPSASGMVLGGRFGFQWVGTNTIAGSGLTTVNIAADGALRIPLGDRLRAQLHASLGYTAASYSGLWGGGPFAEAGASASFRLTSGFSLGLGAAYQYIFDLGSVATLYHGLAVYIGTSFDLGLGGERSRIEIIEPRIDPVFPVFHKYYDSNPFGSIRLRNGESGTVNNVTVSFFVPQFMTQPKRSAVIDELARDEEVDVPLFALFTDEILSVTEDTLVGAEIRVEYSYLDTVVNGVEPVSLRVMNRNAMTWDDDRKAASFVVARNPDLLRFSRVVAGEVRKQPSLAVSASFREAIALFEAIGAAGVNYVVDPSTPYEEYSENVYAVDYLQYPMQTLSYSAGDCDDLSILYAALLESVGIESAFVIVPGHIYVAFALNIPEREILGIFPGGSDLIRHSDKYWVPVEVTLGSEGFLDAWQYGAREWRDFGDSSGSAFIPIRSAWQTYEPVGAENIDAPFDEPDVEQVLRRYSTEIQRFIGRAIDTEVAALESRIQRSGGEPRYVNRLGVLYSRFGLYDEAAVQFQIAADQQYVPAIANLGNLDFLQLDFESAAERFESVLSLEPDNISGLVGLAKCHYELEQHTVVADLYRRISSVDPATASEFSYLVGESSETGRASSAMQDESVIWADEE